MIKIKSIKKLKKNSLIINGSYKLENFQSIAGTTVDDYEKERFGYTVLIDGVDCYVPESFISYEV